MVNKEAVIDKIYEDMIGAQLRKAESLNRWNEADTASYRSEVSKERDVALAQPRKIYKKGENPLNSLGLLPVDDSSSDESDDDRQKK